MPTIHVSKSHTIRGYPVDSKCSMILALTSTAPVVSAWLIKHTTLLACGACHTVTDRRLALMSSLLYRNFKYVVTIDFY